MTRGLSTLSVTLCSPQRHEARPDLPVRCAGRRHGPGHLPLPRRVGAARARGSLRLLPVLRVWASDQGGRWHPVRLPWRCLGHRAQQTRSRVLVGLTIIIMMYCRSQLLDEVKASWYNRNWRVRPFLARSPRYSETKHNSALLSIVLSTVLSTLILLWNNRRVFDKVLFWKF